MNSFKAIVILIFLMPSLVQANKYCFYEDELKGILVIQQNTAYAASSYACQAYYDSKQNHYELHEQVMDKWAKNWGPYFNAVEKYYKRVYGANWKKQYDEDNQKYAIEIAGTIRAGENYCKIIKTELLLRIKNWNRIEGSINTSARSSKHDVIRCK